MEYHGTRPWNAAYWQKELVGGLEHEFYFSIQLGMSSSQLTNSIIFQRGRRKTTNQRKFERCGWFTGWTWACPFAMFLKSPEGTAVPLSHWQHDFYGHPWVAMMMKVRGIISRIIPKRPYYLISGWWVTNFLDRSEEFSWVIARFSWGYLRWTTSFLDLQCILPCSSATILYFPSCRISCYLLRCLIYQWWLVKTNVALQCSLFSMGIPGS